MSTRRPWLAAAGFGLLLAVSACARPKAPALEPAPPLAIPVVPPRVIAGVVEEEPAEPATPADPEPRRPVRPRPRPRPVVPDPTADPQRVPDPAPADQPAESPAARPIEPAGTLRTAETADASEALRRVRDTLARAAAQLARVDPNQLGRDARAQYETARRFIDQAEAALLARNYMFAAYLAGKADTLARALAGR